MSIVGPQNDTHFSVKGICGKHRCMCVKRRFHPGDWQTFCKNLDLREFPSVQYISEYMCINDSSNVTCYLPDPQDQQQSNSLPAANNNLLNIQATPQGQNQPIF